MFFDHHFFHMVAITMEGKEKLFMRDEKEAILATDVGFANYIVGHGGTRARYLRSAYETMVSPDEVWEENPKAKARWVYIKEYATVPYSFSVALVTYRENEAIVVPASSFPCRKGDLKKWRDGKKIYP